MDVTVLMTDSKGKIERDLDMVVEGSKKKKKATHYQKMEYMVMNKSCQTYSVT